MAAVLSGVVSTGMITSVDSRGGGGGIPWLCDASDKSIVKVWSQWGLLGLMNMRRWAGEMTQQVLALPIELGSPSSISQTHMADTVVEKLFSSPDPADMLCPVGPLWWVGWERHRSRVWIFGWGSMSLVTDREVAQPSAGFSLLLLLHAWGWRFELSAF